MILKGSKCLLILIVLGLCQTLTYGRYRCTVKNFIRLGNSCYLLSSEIASWQEAHFRCRDHGAQLAVLATQYEDSTLRTYLERPEFAQLGRWIGGMWTDRWIWAAQGNDIENTRGFATVSVLNLPETDQWMCLYMDPRSRYRWSNDNCIRQLHYICEAPLTKVENITTTSESPFEVEEVEEKTEEEIDEEPEDLI